MFSGEIIHHERISFDPVDYSVRLLELRQESAATLRIHFVAVLSDEIIQFIRSGEISVDIAPDQERVGLFALVLASSLSKSASLALIESLEL